MTDFGAQALESPLDSAAAERSKSLSDYYAQALEEGDQGLANGIFQQQAIESKISQARVDFAGLPPQDRAANNAYPNTAIEVQRLLDVAIQRQTQADSILERLGWKENLEDWFYKDVIEPYKQRNASQLMVSTEGMDPQQMLLAQEQLKPLVMDPMLVAEKRRMLTQIDAQLKTVDPNLSVFNYGPTKRVAEWINREASLGGGYIQSGEVEGTGFLGETGGEIAATALAGAEAVTEFPLQLLYGGMHLVGATPPTNYVEGPDGEILTNAGKVPNLTEAWIAVSARLSGEDVARRLAEHGKLHEIEQGKLTIAQQLSRGIASVAGMGFGFGLPAGAAMKQGQQIALGMMQNGLARMAASGSPKAARAFQLMAGTAGAAVGNGLAEGLAFGRHEGYLKAFQGGAAMAPILMVFGAAGRRMGVKADKAWEKMLSGNKMPKRLREALEGGVEGLGFGVMADAHAYERFEGSLWDYLQDPTQQRWLHYATSVAGLGLFKAAVHRGPLEADTPELVAGRNMMRRLFARKVSQAEEMQGPPEAGPGMTGIGVSRETQLIEGREPTVTDPREAKEQISGVLPGAETQMELGKFGIGEGTEIAPERVRTEDVLAQRTQRPEDQGRDPLEDPGFMERPPEQREAILERRSVQERRQVAESFEGPERRMGERREAEEPSVPDRAELARLREEGPTSANVARIVELMEKARGAYFGAVGEAYGGAAKRLTERPEKAPVEEVTPERKARREQLRSASREARIDHELIRELGDQLRRVDDQSLPREERAKALERVRQLEEDLDVQEAMSDPALNPKLLEELREEGLERLEMPGERGDKGVERIKATGRVANVRQESDPDFGTKRWVAELAEGWREMDTDATVIFASSLKDLERQVKAARGPETLEMPSEGPPVSPLGPRSVSPNFGERYGPGSMRAGSNPYRQQEELARDEALDRSLSEIFQIMEGKQDRPGIRIPLTAKRIFGRKGSPVQTAILEGGLARGRGTGGTLGTFAVYENLVRTKEGLDLVVGLHEWAHSMHRQVFAGRGGDEFWAATKAQFLKLSPDARKELDAILEDYPGADKLPKVRLMAEAWAEWHARNLLGDPILRETYPELSRQVDLWLNAPEQRAFRDGQYRDLMLAVRNWREMGARRRVGLTVRRGGRPDKPYDKPAFLDRASDAVVKAFFDDKILLKRSQQRWLSRADVRPEDLSILIDPSRMIDTVAMTAQKEAESFMLNGPHDVAFRRVHGIDSFKTIMDEVAGTGSRSEKNARIIDFVDFVYATRAIEKIDKDKIMPLPRSDYVFAKTELLQRNPHFQGKMEALKKWTDSLLDLLIDAAQIDKIDAKRMKENGVVYIPFTRIIRDSVSRFGASRGVAEQGTGVKAFRGGSREELVDPVKAMEEVTRSMIVKARKALVVRSLYKLMLHTDVGGLVSQVPKTNVANQYRLDQVMRQLKKAVDIELFNRETKDYAELAGLRRPAREEFEEAFGVFAELLEANELSETLITLFGQKDLPFGEKEPIMAMVPRLSPAEIAMIPSRVGRKQAQENQGKMIWLRVDPPAFEALMGLDVPISRWSMGEGLVKQAVSLPKEVLRTFATDANPAFVLANILRDAVHASVFDRHGKIVPFKGFALLAQGAYLQLRYGSRLTPMFDRMFGEGNPEAREMWQMFEASGASTSSFFNEGMRRQLRGEIQSVTSRSRAALDSWKRAMAAPESWIRVAEFARVLKAGRKAGKDKLEASYEALEAAREVTVNFARAGDLARAYNQMTPYFAATVAGQRKMLRGLLGQEGRSDVERAAYQRRVWAQALSTITLPTIAAWLAVKDEDWYQDLPEWRKKNFINFKLPGTDEIVSLPLPFEVGTIFGSLPTAWLEKQTGGNPINMGDAFLESLFPYFEHTSSLVPAFIRPIAETYTGKDFFRGRELTPFWVEKTKPPGEQLRDSTTRTAQWMFQIFGRHIPTVDNPIELEQLLGGYTADFARTLMQASDEIAGLKDHPGLRFNPFGRFARQTPHGASRAVDDIYEEGKRIEQIEAGSRTPADRGKLTRINRAKQEFSRIRKDLDLGRITREEADERMFRIAHRTIGRSQ